MCCDSAKAVGHTSGQIRDSLLGGGSNKRSRRFRVLVFIDESGDAGFKLSKGSSSIFAVGMVMFKDAESAQKTQVVIDELKKKLGIKPEFKFSKSSADVRDAFFANLRGLP